MDCIEACLRLGPELPGVSLTLAIGTGMPYSIVPREAWVTLGLRGPTGGTGYFEDRLYPHPCFLEVGGRAGFTPVVLDTEERAALGVITLQLLGLEIEPGSLRVKVRS